MLGSDSLQPSGFFALRTPLLPFDEWRAWSDGLQAPRALTDHVELEAALAADRALLTDRLHDLWRRPAVHEAVFLASPELDAALERLDAAADGSFRAVRGLVAYFARMTGRATPFGLFAGCSVGTVDKHTRLELPDLAAYLRHTRLDMDYLSALVTELDGTPAVRDTRTYEPNSSLHPAGDRLHYAESSVSDNGRSYRLVALEKTEELLLTLARASNGAHLNDLAAALVDGDVGDGEARAFVDELVDSQMLVSDLAPAVTGDDATQRLIVSLRAHAETRPVADCLELVLNDLAHVDSAGVGGSSPQRYSEVRATLDRLPVKTDTGRLFQVDLVIPAPGLSLGKVVVDEVARGLEILHRLARRDRQFDPLSMFREQFVARYEGAEVPLMEALDEETGIGFAATPELSVEPLISGLDVPPPSTEPGTWLATDDVLLRLLAEALSRGEHEISLQAADLDALTAADAPPLPDALEVFARLAGPSAEAIDRGEFRLRIVGASGPSGAKTLGRFCHVDPMLHGRVDEHLRAEEALRPDAIFAEIVHLPEGRLGNVLSRPVLRAYEIPFLGHSGTDKDRQIPVADLRVSVRAGRVVLRSARLDREVLPRLSTAHDLTLPGLGVYRFLCSHQQQGTAARLGWSWGPLQKAPFLPRVVSGRLVLARAGWNLTASELRPLLESRSAAQFAAVQEWRLLRRLPRYVALAGDNELVVDFDNVLSVEAFLHLVRGRDHTRLVELFPPPDELCVSGPAGRFVHELVVPFVRLRPPAAKRRVHAPDVTAQRRFPPGSEWLYAKLYTGPATADRLLLEVIRPAVGAALGSGTADSWFFIRYADPEYHLRLRFHGDPPRLAAELLPALAVRFAAPLEDGRLHRWQVDTYVPEFERYGGDEGMRLSERLFTLDSECALAILESTPGDEGLAWRWKLALLGVDLLLESLDFDFKRKQAWARHLRDAHASEFHDGNRARQRFGQKFRTERQALDDLLRRAHSPEAFEHPALQALRRRSEGAAPIGDELQALDRAGRLGVSVTELAASYTHMQINRLLRSAHQLQELAIYDLLDRLYSTQAALGTGG